MLFNILIWMELNFHKINSIFSSIDPLVVCNDTEPKFFLMFMDEGGEMINNSC